MTLRVAIVADDLTGALDTSAPFVAAGMTTSVAVTPETVDDALATRPDVVVVNTGSRGVSPADAADRVTRVARRLLAASPEVLFKKIDSRLQGNVAAETAALAAVFAATRIVVAPAVPDQGRTTRDGAVTGKGVPIPLPIRPLFAGTKAALDIIDAVDDADLDAAAALIVGAPATLAVGARGLGAALARRFGRGLAKPGWRFSPSHETLFLIGSRDPITRAQVDHLVAVTPDATEIAAPHGALPTTLRLRLPSVVRCTGDGPANGMVADRFATAALRVITAARPQTLVASGGDTMLAILRAVRIGVIRPLGEAAPGVPWFEIPWKALPGQVAGDLVCVAKSGGFGQVTVLSDLIQVGATAMPTRDRLDEQGHGAADGPR